MCSIIFFRSCPEGKKVCNDHHCIPEDQKCCPVGEIFCNQSDSCLPNGTMCCPIGKVCFEVITLISKGFTGPFPPYQPMRYLVGFNQLCPNGLLIHITSVFSHMDVFKYENYVEPGKDLSNIDDPFKHFASKITSIRPWKLKINLWLVNRLAK